jgi:hypothetical protein
MACFPILRVVRFGPIRIRTAQQTPVPLLVCDENIVRDALSHNVGLWDNPIFPRGRRRSACGDLCVCFNVVSVETQCRWGRREGDSFVLYLILGVSFTYFFLWCGK